MIEILEDKDFDEMFDIMCSSFPAEERRSYKEQKALLSNPKFTIYVMRNEEAIMGFITLWRLDGFDFIDHFAVNPIFRNKGVGAKLLRELAVQRDGRLCLEVETPESEIAERRIHFYERNGFYLNRYPYTMPPMSEGKPPVPMLIMTSGGEITEDEFETVKNELYREVYHNTISGLTKC